jgi:CHASE4 domain.
LIIIATSILKSDKTGSVDGTLIMGRFISEVFIKRLEETKSEPLSDKEQYQECLKVLILFFFIGLFVNFRFQ